MDGQVEGRFGLVWFDVLHTWYACKVERDLVWEALK